MKNLSTPFNKNTPKHQMTLSYPHPQMPTPHQFDLVQPTYMLQYLPSHMVVQGKAQTAYDHNIWKTTSSFVISIPITAGDASTSLLT